MNSDRFSCLVPSKKKGSNMVFNAVLRELLKTKAKSRGFQQPTWDLANVNALKNHV